MIYEEGCFVYRDKYFGNNPFIGEEVVWKYKNIIWAMNYYGVVIDEIVSLKDIYVFLRDALKRVTVDYPFRGPGLFEKGFFKYVNHIKGNISSFVGKEEIFFKDKLVYVLYYHGGFVRTKH